MQGGCIKGMRQRTGEAGNTVLAAKVLVRVGVDLRHVDLVFGLRERVRDLLVGGRKFLKTRSVWLTVMQWPGGRTLQCPLTVG